MSITYEEALSTLNAMFSDRWDEDSLDTVLRHFEGHMENTVDAVLAHGDAPPSELVRRLEASRTGASISEMDAELARQLANQEEAQTRTSSNTPTRNLVTRGDVPPALRRGDAFTRPSPPSNAIVTPAENVKVGRGVPTRLPPDFLRIPGMEGSMMSSDEALARMLQDKLFAEEIKNNPEFAHLARGGGMRRTENGGLGMNGMQRKGTGEPQVLKALSEMGEQAKKRFQDLATKFKQKLEQQNNQNNMSFGGSRSGVSERRGLLDIHDDDDEQEISFVGGSGTHEMRSMDTSFAMSGSSRYGKKDD